MPVDVLLIKPDFNDIAVLPPLGLAYLGSALNKINLAVKIHDNTLFKFDDHQLVSLFKDAAPLIIGISAATPMINRALEISALAKQVNPKILVVLGGPHPSYAIREVLSYEAVDVIVKGEGEQSFPEIALSFKDGNGDFSKIKGCAFKNPSREIVINPDREIFGELDLLPFPYLDSLPLELYFKMGYNFGVLQKNPRSLPIIASRGCPSNCTFCQRFLGKKFRIRSAENIVDELSYHKNKYNVTEFNFLDDNFTLNKKHVVNVCDLIHKRNLHITFRFPNGVREDFLDGEILSALKSVGCYHLDFGIESGSQRVLDLMKKGKTLEKIKEKVYLCKKNGFKVSASFLFGTPGETIEDMKLTIRFAISLPLDSASFGIVIPFPGTELRKEAIEKKFLREHDYKYYNPTLSNFRPLIETPEWSPEDLLKILKKANRDFFLRPKQVLKMFTLIASPGNSKRYIKSVNRILKLLTRR